MSTLPATRRFYYLLKPFLPFSLRRALRRWRALQLRSSLAGVWPISEAAARAPIGWPGWPGGKRFALVLTHDVERLRGLNRCRPLAELEMRLGFRSSFNFVPEGEYARPQSLCDFLTAEGFEIGIHDLKHDGKLYWSPRIFKANAEKINRHLREWQAVGFRSGFMLHELSWLHQLNILYDASTFDTDPFEPQPGGMETIFPFKVWGKNGAGYVELPYTLPQDSTLFILFQERSIDTWKRKLAWIAERGGMALMIVHPDYAHFGGGSPSHREYDSARYQDFLQWIKQEYAGDYWHALPKDVAAFVGKWSAEQAESNRALLNFDH